jgi:hypothetical protein
MRVLKSCWVTRAFVITALIPNLSGCVSTPKMNANAPIEKRSAFLGTSYEQSGAAIDRADMINKLEQEPAAREELSGYRVIATTSLILAAAGGALVGWPVGQAIADKEEPLWALAGVGGGLIVVGIPLAIVADNKVDSAVDAHNRRVRTPTSHRRACEYADRSSLQLRTIAAPACRSVASSF